MNLYLQLLLVLVVAAGLLGLLYWAAGHEAERLPTPRRRA